MKETISVLGGDHATWDALHPLHTSMWTLWEHGITKVHHRLHLVKHGWLGTMEGQHLFVALLDHMIG